MGLKDNVLSRFSERGGEPARPLYLPDLTLWYAWHQRRGTMSPEWHNQPLGDIARAMGVPIWHPVRPWHLEMTGVEVVTTESDDQRLVQYCTSAGTLLARWQIGPDGDWWQTEYPVKAAGDLPAALEWAAARSYQLQPDRLTAAQALVGSDGIVALELPRRPLSDLLHEFLGWSEGLALLGEPAINEILSILEEKAQLLVQGAAQHPGEIVFSPDNLDGQFISPRMFKRNMAESYRRTALAIHDQGKQLLVHVGGSVRHLLPLLAEADVDGIEGIAGPPQSDATLAEARNLIGPRITLWGGIAQDFLLATHERQAFEAAVRQAAREANGDGRSILGVSDRVPVAAELDRLLAIPALVKQGL